MWLIFKRIYGLACCSYHRIFFLQDTIYLSVDRIPPVINCPGLFVQETTVTTGTVVNFPEPTATDNSGSVSLVSRVPVPGSVFTVGDTLVTYIFQDPSRNPATCRFIVSVIVGEY